MLKISVVIPTYCRPQLLKRCLAALAIQDFDPDEFELIVVTDGPDPETKKLESFPMNKVRIRFLQLPNKKGPAAARNLGWKKAEGKLIAFTDDDTIPDRQWLSGFWKAYNGSEYIAFTGRIKVPLRARPTDYEKNTAGLETAAFVTANCCCSKAALQKVGGFDERFTMAWREDSDLEFKLIYSKVPILHVSGAIVVHPVRSASWGVSIREQKKGMFNALLYKKYPQLYREKIQPAPPWNYYLMVGAVVIFIIAKMSGYRWTATAALLAWIVLFVSFTVRRLRHTSRSMDHISEMIVTSAVIPFLSIYWQLYGAWRYRVLFI
jgi:glycosyltransferase involved in cell wall biosynthesis